MSRQSDFIPNSFQTPNVYVDDFLYLLTGEEWKVLSYSIRRILGFQKRRDRISLSQFSEGLADDDGNQLDGGCGLSVDTLVKVLANLVRFGFLVKTSEHDSRNNLGAEYELQLDDTKINLTQLLSRRDEKKALNTKRTRKAVSVLFAKRALSDRTTPPIVGQNDPPIVGQTHNNQRKPEKSSNPPAPTLEQIREMSVNEALRLPEIRLYKKITDRIPGHPQWELIVEFMRAHKPTEESLRECWRAWSKQNYRPGGLGWMDWVVEGIPSFGKKPNGNGKPSSPTKRPALTEEQLEESRREAEKIFGVGG